jgi:hypothetical protein
MYNITGEGVCYEALMVICIIVHGVLIEDNLEWVKISVKHMCKLRFIKVNVISMQIEIVTRLH